MSSKVFWKLFASALFLAYAIYRLTPLTTTPFEEFVQDRATANQAEFKQILGEAKERVVAAGSEGKGAQTTFYSALRDIGAGKGKSGKPIDLHQFIPNIRLASDPNVVRRNDYLLRALLRQSQGSLKLGLDLQGGVSFTLFVDPKNFEMTAEDIEAAERTAIKEATKGLTNPTAPAAANLSAEEKATAQKAWDAAIANAKKIAAKEAKESVDAATQRLKDGLDQAIRVMEDRVNSSGVSEPLIRRVGSTSIEVQLAGENAANDPEVINALKKPAKLEFRMVHRYLNPEAGTPENRIVPLREDPNDPASPISNYEVLYQRHEVKVSEAGKREYANNKAGDVIETPLYVEKRTAAGGNIVSKARPASQDGFSYQTSISFTSAGAKKFEELTGKIAEKNNLERNSAGRLAIVLDGKLVLAPGLKIDDKTGTYRAIGDGGASIEADNLKAASDLANVLNNPLAFPLDLQDSKQIGASLANDAKVKSVNAAVWGIGLVLVFMILYYLWAGAIAVVGLVLNVILMLGLMAAFGATITLPGVAAIVLTIGMAVDSNILIFERIREELAEGKTFKAAVHSGYDRAQATILDVNLTSLMSAIVLIWMGTGPVRGFGIILAIGLVTTVFTSLITCRALQEFCVDKGVFTKIFGLHLFKGNTHFQFLNAAKPAFLISWTVALASIVALVAKGSDAFSKDFKGGEAAIVQVVQGKQLDIGDIVKAATDAGVADVSAAYQSALSGNQEQTLRIETELSANKKLADGKQKLADFTQANRAVEAVRARFPDHFPQGTLESIIVGRESVGGAVSEGLQQNAIISMILALLGIAVYVALRFESGMGLGAFISSLHDVLLTAGLYILVGKQFSIAMIAALLMVIGYSINDTIVVFDRIREEMKRHPSMSLRDVIHLSINRTLSRTVLTSITIFLSALALWLLGAGDVKEYGLIFIFGIVTGTFSSIYIASPIFYWWHKGERTSVERAEAQVHYEWEAGSERKSR